MLYRLTSIKQWHSDLAILIIANKGACMKNRLTFLVLFCLFWLSVSTLAEAAFAQQPVSREKKRAMHRLDPTDIFSEASEGSVSERKNNRKSRRRQSEATIESGETLSPTPIPAPEAISSSQTQTSDPLAAPTPLTVVGETGWNTPNSPKESLEATNASLSSLPSNGKAVNSILSLPVLLTLFVLVLATLIFVLVKMVKNIRRPVN